MTLLGKRVFADIIELRALQERGRLETQGRLQTKEAETGEMRSQARKPGAGRGKEAPPLEPLEGAQPCPHLDLGCCSL